MQCHMCGKDTLIKAAPVEEWPEGKPVDADEYCLWECECGNAIKRKDDGSRSKDPRWAEPIDYIKRGYKG